MPWIILTDDVCSTASESLVDYTGGVTLDNAAELDGLPFRFLLTDDDGLPHYTGRFDREAFDTIDDGGDGSLTAALMLGAVVSGTTDLYVLADDLGSLGMTVPEPTPAMDRLHDGLRWHRII